MKTKEFNKLILLNLFTSGHCMITQIALTMAFSYIFSNSIYIFTLFTGLYLMSMGMGVLIVEKFTFKKNQLINLVIINSLIGIILANPGIISTIILNEWARFLLRSSHIDISIIVFIGGIILTILIGIVSGAELPIFSKLVEEEQWHASRPIIGVLVSDYFGASLGIIIFTFILNPFAGLINAVLISQILTLGFTTFIFFSLKLSETQLKLKAFIFALTIYVAGSFLFHKNIINFIDAFSGF